MIKNLNVKVKIIHREAIKVNFGSRQAALDEEYDDFPSNCVNGYGVVYPFTGIRGDAKALWKQIKNNTKKDQIRLVKAATPKE